MCIICISSRVRELNFACGLARSGFQLKIGKVLRIHIRIDFFFIHTHGVFRGRIIQVAVEVLKKLKVLNISRLINFALFFVYDFALLGKLFNQIVIGFLLVLLVVKLLNIACQIA